MNEPRYWVLLIEDNPGDVRLVREMLEGDSSARLEIEYASTLAEGFERLQAHRFDVALLDLGLPDSQGLETITRFQARFPDVPVIILTGNDDLDLALVAVKAGAQDYLIKGEISSSPLVRAVRYAIERRADITERRRAEEALRKSEGALKEAQRAAHLGHWEHSVLTGVTTWSDEVYRILQIGKGSVTPSRELFFSMIDAGDRCRLEAELARALSEKGKGNIEIDLRITTPDGAALVVSHCVFVDRDSAGNVVGVHGTVQDITRRVATEQALRDSETALAEAQEIAHVGSAIVYPATLEIQASDEYFRVFDLEPRPGTPIKAFLDRVHEEDRGPLEAALKAAVSSGVLDIEFRIVCGDGSTRFAHGKVRKRAGNQRILGLLGTVEDVTERKRTEDALRQHSESLERSNLDLERFNRMAVGRELRMIELKREVNDLCMQVGQPERYVLREEPTLAKETS